jgi:hypothetical protein
MTWIFLFAVKLTSVISQGSNIYTLKETCAQILFFGAQILCRMYPLLLHGTRTILVREIVRDHFIIKAQTSNVIDTSGTR